MCLVNVEELRNQQDMDQLLEELADIFSKFTKKEMRDMFDTTDKILDKNELIGSLVIVGTAVVTDILERRQKNV